MCLSATLIATDTIAPLTLIDQKAYPTLFSVVFGEGVSNDAVALLIMNVVLQMKGNGKSSRGLRLAEVGGGLIGEFAVNFISTTFKSVGFGIFMGISC